ncbi:MAG: hypothetical protein HW421_3492 [Ignavibacteria bacterium]|nr:hypothetical protein [Ignavibacteria bacterium]
MSKFIFIFLILALLPTIAQSQATTDYSGRWYCSAKYTVSERKQSFEMELTKMHRVIVYFDPEDESQNVKGEWHLVESSMNIDYPDPENPEDTISFVGANIEGIIIGSIFTKGDKGRFFLFRDSSYYLTLDSIERRTPNPSWFFDYNYPVSIRVSENFISGIRANFSQNHIGRYFDIDNELINFSFRYKDDKFIFSVNPVLQSYIVGYMLLFGNPSISKYGFWGTFLSLPCYALEACNTGIDVNLYGRYFFLSAKLNSDLLIKEKDLKLYQDFSVGTKVNFYEITATVKYHIITFPGLYDNLKPFFSVGIGYDFGK